MPPKSHAAMNLPPLILPDGITVPDVDMLRTQAPDFRLYTASLEDTGGVLTHTADGNSDSASVPTLHAIGSSTVQDLQGDTMELSALQDMTKVQPGFATMLNHSYNLPEDLAGHLIKSPSIQVDGGIGDLLLDIAIWQGNPRAMQTYSAIKAGTTLGISIGCMIEEAEWRGPNGEMLDQESVDFWDVIDGKVFLHITHVNTVEFSIVAIPANRRSWVQYAAQGMLQRSLAEGRTQDALRLAPIVRASMPDRYRDIVRSVDDNGLQKQLANMAPRRGTSRNALWSPATRTFSVSSPSGLRGISRDALNDLLAKHANTHAGMPTTAVASVTGDPDIMDDGMEDTTLKSVTGKSSWPLAERDHAWDSGAAHSRLLDWAGGKDDLSVSKFRSVHFWSPDGDAAENVSDYKLAFCDLISGEVKAIPKGIMACWGGHGVEATTGISDADKEAIKKKLSAYAARMRTAFDDPDIMPPWDKEDGKSTEPDMTASAETTDKPTTDKPTSDEPPENPLAEKIVSGTAGGITVKADGSHAPYDGTHTHAHAAFGSQGDDTTHEHEHTHSGDASHDHPHTDSATPDTQASVTINDDGTHAPMSGTHTHSHTDGQGGQHGHEHEHHDDANHGHTHSDGSDGADGAEKSAEPTLPSPQKTPSSPDAGVLSEKPEAPTDALLAARTETLKFYNSLGASLGFPAMTLDGTPDVAKCGLVDNDQDAQRVITLVSGLDTLTDELMDILCIPDVDDVDDDTDGSDGDESMSASATTGATDASGEGVHQHSANPIAIDRAMRRAITHVLRHKAGREFSAENMASLQLLHDELSNMTDGAVCQAMQSATQQEEEDKGGTDAANEGAATAQPESISLMVESVQTLTKAIGDSEYLRATVSGVQQAAETLKQQVADYAASARAEHDAITARIKRLKEVPLPRPTQMARSIVPTDPALARYQDFFPGGLPATGLPGSEPLALEAPAALDDVTRAAEYTRALDGTRITKRSTDGMTCRYWPAGIGILATGQSVRPALENEQKASMGFSEWTAYESGGAALVPEPGS